MNDKVIRVLTACAVISSAAFAKLNPVEQTATMTSAGGKPLVFVKDFVALGDRKALVQKLLAGTDVSMELEFNGIELSPDEAKAVKLVQPVLERIGFKGPGQYEWVTPTAEESRTISRIVLEDNRVYRSRGGYSMTKAGFKKLWEKASKSWATGEKFRPYEGSFNGYSRRAYMLEGGAVEVGCQTLTRAEIEHVARHYGFDPVTE